jgi:hypothetical protein
MAMSRKDYRVIADALKEAHEWAALSKLGGDKMVVDDTIRFVACALYDNYPKFDKDTFLKACDYMKGLGE